MKNNLTNFESKSSRLSSLYTLSICIIALFGALLVLPSSREEQIVKQDNIVVMDLISFQDPVVTVLPEEELTDHRIVELTEPEELTNYESLPAEVPVEHTSGVEVENDTIELTTDLGSHTANPVISESVVDKDLIVFQLTSLIEERKEYSTRAQQRGIEGTVVIEVMLSKDCVVSSYSILESDNSLLDGSVEETMERIIGNDISEQVLQESLSVIVPIEFVLI